MRRRERGRRAGPVLGVAVALALVAMLAGCGGDPAEPGPLGEVKAGSVATFSDCADWREGGVAERLATIAEVRNQVGADVDEATFSDDDAYAYISRACEPEYASSFRLYRLYNRGASFQQLDE